MLNTQELANFITDKLNIISTTRNAGYVFDIYAEVGKNENDGHIKGVLISRSNNPLVVKSLASVKLVYTVELSIPIGMTNKNLIKIQEIIGEFVETYEDTEQEFTGGKASFDITYAHLPTNYKIENATGGTVSLQFEMTINYTDNGLLGSSKVWLLDGVEIPYTNEAILLQKEGQTNRISKEYYNKSIMLAQTKYYKFTIPFDATSTVCTTLQADLLAGDFKKTYTLSYYDGVNYTSSAPYTTTVSIFQSGDSKSDGGAISMFDITFADVSATETTPQYTIELFSTPFDENNIRYFDSVEEQTVWYDSQPIHAPAVQIKAPTLNTILNTTQVYDFSGLSNFTYSPTDLVNMNVARINEKTNKVDSYSYQINTRRGYHYTGNVVGGNDNPAFSYWTNQNSPKKPIVLNGSTYYITFEEGSPQIFTADNTEITIDEYYQFILPYWYYLREDETTFSIVDENGVVYAYLEKQTATASVQFTVVDDRVLTLQVNRTDGAITSILIIENGQTLADITTSKQFSLNVLYSIDFSSTTYADGWISQNGTYITAMSDNSISYDWIFNLRGGLYKVNENIVGVESYFDIYKDNGTQADTTIAENLANGGTFTITEPIEYNRYYYRINSAEIGANNQIILTLQLDTIQTYVINPKLKFSECLINKANLNRFIDNGNGTVSFNGGVESPLFEREEMQNVAKRLVLREVLKYDYGKYNIEDYAESAVERYRRVEEWFQNNIMGWLYAFFPKGKNSYKAYQINYSLTDDFPLRDVDFSTCNYKTFDNDTIYGNFIVFCCPIYKTLNKIILTKTEPDDLHEGTITYFLDIETEPFINYIQDVFGSNPEAYSLKFSTKPPIVDFKTALMGFDVDSNGNLVSNVNKTYFANKAKNTTGIDRYVEMRIYDFNGIRTNENKRVYEEYPNTTYSFDGCFVCESPLVETMELEDYILANPLTFPKQNTQYIEKTFYRLKRFNLAKTVPQTYSLVRPAINVSNISITVKYKETGALSDITTYNIANQKGTYNIEGGLYRLTINESNMVFEINQLPANFSYFEYIEFKERIYGIVGADKSPLFNPKLLNSDFRALRLTNERGGEFEYDIQKLNTEVVETAVTEQITPDLQRTYFRAINTDGVYQRECSQNLTGLVDSAEMSMPLATDPWRKTLAEQPNYFVQRRVENIKNALGAGIAGAFGGGSNIGLKGGATGALAGAVAGMAISSINSAINDYFSDDNMNKQPYMIQNANGNVIFNLAYTTPGMTIEQYALLPQEERIINDQMFANGFTYNRIDQIRNFMHTRKYFNTLTANIETMSGLPLSNEVRDDIKQRFANGVRLWHSDEIQYEKENYELWLEE
jgi:hypothetical protein